MNAFKIRARNNPSNRNKTFNAFSLVETAIVIVITGILIGIVIKAKDSILGSAKIRSVVSDVQMLQVAYNDHTSTYANSNGDTQNNSQPTLVDRLKTEGLLEQSWGNNPKIGKFEVKEDNGTCTLAIKELTKDQASSLKSKLLENKFPELSISEENTAKNTTLTLKLE
jgi:type II secretory pathway pseudopilin PulG